ncbi:MULTISPECIES: LysR family transcriptional regulator [Actibacterium]|uniref:DNA-binding transcriptional LysR family regulator n=1 Tax=Actibacterium naphthalenivorans TaxID=1614693 RepID=A0A840CJ18_9RHOB|nr:MULTISPECIES: LysR family transcriptional regulator [Actibacterium]ALG90633.1 LysR family transcriptional regulator [Actibacterium sp. EMB200-NS6]MBB4023189.1 DNA-binding transcriptional LysR family regulator [Actibacterium naphthalenivorans]
MIDKLEMFIALARNRHFGRAAEECGVTQPTLSAAIKQLEEQLGVMLVWRGSRYRGLTPEGARVLEWARQIVGDARTMREEMRAVKQGLSGKLRLAVIPTALAMMSSLTTPLSARHPNLKFTVLSRTSAEILQLLENLEIDAGITYLDNEPLGRVTTVPLFAEHYNLVTRADTPLSDRQSVTWAEVAALPLCLLTPDMQNRRIINRHMAQAGAQVAPRLESNSVITLTSHVLTGDWATILPLQTAEFFLASGALSAVPIVAPEAAHLVGLVAPHREPHTPVLDALLTAARRLGSPSD